MKALESRVVELERKTGAPMPAFTVNVRFVPATDGRPCPAPEPYETLAIHIGPNRPEVPA